MKASELNLKTFAKIAEKLELLFSNEALAVDTNFKLCAQDYSEYCPYMLDNIIRYDSHNLMETIIFYYYSAVNTASNVIPERSVILDALKSFDDILNSSYDNKDELKKIIDKLHNVISFEESSINFISIKSENGAISRIISYAHLYAFLSIAKQQSKMKQLTKYSFEPDYFYHYLDDNVKRELEIAKEVVNNFIKKSSLINANIINYLGIDEASYDILSGDLDHATAEPDFVKKEVIVKPVTNTKTKVYYGSLEEDLNSNIIGQEDAINKITERLKTLEYGVKHKRGAKAVYMLLGPTGVGKTETVKLLNELICPDTPLIRLDMGEYKEEHTISKIIGAPPGYIGYSNNKNVLETIRTNPGAIILIDEIEKAHPKVIEVFLHMFDEGKAVNSYQKEVDLSNNIFFMTSNVGSFEASRNKIGYTSDHTPKDIIYLSALKKQFSPEFINRINDVIIFQNLSISNVYDIINLQIEEIEELFKGQKDINIEINLTNEVYDFLINKMDYKEYGAREIKRVLERYIYNNLIDYIIKIGYQDLSINFELIDEKVVINNQKHKVLTKKP